MRTAVSIPDAVYSAAERLARRLGKTRSALYAEAIRDYVARHAPDEVTEAMDQVCLAVEQQADRFVSAAARRVLERTEW